MRYIFGAASFLAVLLTPVATPGLIGPKVPEAPTTTTFTGTLLGAFKVTAYRSVRASTDSSPYWSSIGIHTNPWMVAVSQDFLKDGRLQYNDVIYIEDVGFKVVGDAMNKRLSNQLDVWVETYKEEQNFHREFNRKKLGVYLVKRGK